MRNIKIYATLLLALSTLPQISFGQTSYPNLFYNNGDQVFIQSGALLHVQGDVVNNNVPISTSGLTSSNSNVITNNGLLNVEGDFNNSTSSLAYGSSGERTVRLIGNAANAGSATPGVQTISGSLNATGTSAFYNLVIDRGVAAEVVSLASPVTVDGSLLWNGSSTTTATYNPATSPISTDISNGYMSVRGVTPSGNGIIKMYNGTTDNGLTITNPATSSNVVIAGYQPIVAYSYSGATGGSAALATNDQYVQSRGVDQNSGASLGVNTGLIMTINGTGTYTFPVGSPNKYYNPIQVNFPVAPSSVQLTAKFTESTTLTGTSGSFVSAFTNDYAIAQSPVLTSAQQAYIAAHPDFSDNPGYNVYQADCEGNNKWFIMNSFINNHGYWSLNGTLGRSYYTVQAFPHGYNDVSSGGSTGGPNKRLVMESADAFSSAPSAANFNSAVESGTGVNSPTTDILHYSYLGSSRGNFASTACLNDATGIPGGGYTSFGHFVVGSPSNSTSEALPVQLVALSADPVDNQYIRVNWVTASEVNNKGFEVQRSLDGTNFTTIGWVDGNGTTQEQHNYLYNDQTVMPNTIYYYRLNQVDVDGNGTLTYIVSASISDGPSITVSDLSPNPTSGATRLVISTTEAQSVSVKFYDILGKLIVNSDNNQISMGTNTLDFNLGGLADATYTAIIKIGSQTYSKKIVLVK